MKTDFKLLVNGELIDGVSTFDVVNPATEDVFAQCPGADEAILNRAVSAAKAALPGWSALSADERAGYINRLADAMEARIEDFARLLTAEQGKPLDQATYEIGGSIYTLRAFAAMRLPEQTLRNENGSTVVEHRTPLGVCASITPWNFPVILLANKLGPCLVMGNTMVSKPAPTTPLTTLLLAELAADILPAGVFNVICDQNELGPLITAHPDIAKVAFTGSTATGKKVMASAAQNVKRVTLELGGNDAAIVLDDVPARIAAQKVYAGAMANAGQICVAIKRAYVPSAMYEEFCDEIAKLADQAVLDDGAKQGSTIGPIQNRMQFEKVRDLIEDAKQRGRVVAGGDVPDRKGFFIPPTVIADLDDDAPLVREEQFGPVLPVLKYDDIEDVIARANDSPYGLGGTVWGADQLRAMDVARRIDAGTVWVNQHLAIDPNIPFRGAKQSGLGTEHGLAGLMEYTQAHIVSAVPLELEQA
ncbi:aldehyde dehydrogenase family protein [Novosphingobium sp. ST904]|uniref:aldehyde dehydrogenase family protein n=1 Tax=Novosphingobium sp. ST904 TaxID=1684385 RepID=UPI0006C8C4D9|nr:aldehyde dehydrogenase family protein [Novosphingobium sp. ST904]KPH62609.1 aldehyde dehydrogenase [Novosphingobium sp. ST904]TCM33076.1 acyl-CoA reductase-like NAD-dependent aldehyde dehydrogenase [Novosphingobium sp. ST904]